MKTLFTTAFMALFGIYALVHLGWIEADSKVTATAPPKAQVAGTFTERIAMAKPKAEGRYTLRAMR